jgi:predicted ATPase
VIRRLIVKGFKRLESETLEFRDLTILAGLNGAGKTSAIHALLLVRHAWARQDGTAELNGPFGMELGWFQNVVNSAVDGGFTIAIEDGSGDSTSWKFEEGDTELYARVAQSGGRVSPFSKAKARGFQYLSAERNGPRMTQKAAPLPIEMLEVGFTGEYVAQVLDRLGSAAVPKARRVASDEVEELALVKAQTERWLSRITRHIEIDTASFAGTDVVALQFRTDGASPWVRPTNMGFGISYALPVVVAAMTAAEGGLIIVENPEAHLHPAGQSEMGTFLARMAAAGLQIIVETHSDHVLNGIRLGISEHRALSSSNAIVHFFSDQAEIVQPLVFTPTGGMSDWPAGFFDQYRLDVQRLTMARRPV